MRRGKTLYKNSFCQSFVLQSSKLMTIQRLLIYSPNAAILISCKLKFLQAVCSFECKITFCCERKCLCNSKNCNPLTSQNCWFTFFLETDSLLLRVKKKCLYSLKKCEQCSLRGAGADCLCGHTAAFITNGSSCRLQLLPYKAVMVITVIQMPALGVTGQIPS